MTGRLTFDRRKLLQFAAITIVLASAVTGATRALLRATLDRPYDKDAALMNLGVRRDRGTPVVFAGDRQPPAMPAVTTSVLDRVRGRGTLRVGYFDDSLPYAFVNRRGELVGFDVEMALQLARDLGATAEFVQLDRRVFESGLDSRLCDLLMSGVPITADRSLRVQFSTSYLDETFAFIVPDSRTSEFSFWANVRTMKRLRLAVPRAPYFLQKVRDEVANAEIVPIERLDQAFGPTRTQVDAVVMTAERGSAYTLLFPEFSVAVPKPRPFKVPLAYVIAGRDAPMTAMVDTWIDLKRKDGTIDELFAHWILGQDSGQRARRWSVAEDVLHWW